MKFLDLLRMSSSNLWKRKVRTILTVLGVVIGVASIVVMISLGLGLSRSLMEQYESYGSLTQITVYEPWSYDSGNSEEQLRLDDELIKTIGGMEHVVSVYPVLQTSALAKYGAYTNYLQILAMPLEAIQERDITVGEGSLPSENDEELKLFYGCQVLQDFSNEKTGAGYWQTGELPDIDLMNDPIFIIFDTSAYWQSQYPSESGEMTVKPPKKYLIETCGVEAQPPEDSWSQNAWYTFCDIEQLIPQLQKVFKNKVIPGQPSTKAGKPYKEIFYSQLIVNVDEMDNVTEIQTRLTDMGYEASSNAEWIESEQKTLGYVQAVLGGIGAVSLFVAAIGITNTMMMSIYERTKEIGVMKVLGCDLRNIRSLFLLEAGFIGFIGGIIGLALSYTLSFVINKFAAGAQEFMSASTISYIPLWLAGISLVFAVLVGMVAGFFPALRAMRLSPLAAIRTE
ncbi:MAG: ABC transporter permease [Roseburia sp.]|nr:ABC transporter permease [Ruminococcus sp.]MCM1155000.1 ABC transporter permease [Roseburia sp.]MCM1242058.1 ABC transporter permease [Roseburia sp.]